MEVKIDTTTEDLDAPRRTFNAILVATTLVVLAIGLIVQIGLARWAAPEVITPTAKALVSRTAILALAMLAFDLVILFWLGIRVLTRAGRSAHGPRCTRYVDAWAEAGQRIQLPNEDETEDSEDSEDP